MLIDIDVPTMRLDLFSSFSPTQRATNTFAPTEKPTNNPIIKFINAFVEPTAPTAASAIFASQKRPVNAEAVANDIENALYNSMKREISSQKIGEMAMERLRELDTVAYVRFASVHREFKDIDAFVKEISELKNDGAKDTHHDH